MVRAQVKAYLAHTFKHRKYIKEVLSVKINALGIETRNPFYESDGTTNRKEVALADQADIQGIVVESQNKDVKDQEKWIRMVRKNSSRIVPRDLHFINTTDFTIAYLTEISIGTCTEIFYTGVTKRRPVFLLTNNPEVYEHPWIIYECRFGRVCKTEEELIKALKRKYG